MLTTLQDHAMYKKRGERRRDGGGGPCTAQRPAFFEIEPRQKSHFSFWLVPKSVRLDVSMMRGAAGERRFIGIVRAKSISSPELYVGHDGLIVAFAGFWFGS